MIHVIDWMGCHFLIWWVTLNLWCFDDKFYSVPSNIQKYVFNVCHQNNKSVFGASAVKTDITNFMWRVINIILAKKVSSQPLVGLVHWLLCCLLAMTVWYLRLSCFFSNARTIKIVNTLLDPTPPIIQLDCIKGSINEILNLIIATNNYLL